MFVTYCPEGEPAQTWDWEPDRVRSSEQVIVEKMYGGTWTEFVQGSLGGRATARRVLLCHLMRRVHPALQLRDVPDFMACELTVEQSLAELTATYDTWVAGGGQEGDDAAILEGMFQADFDKARKREGDVAAGKALSRNEPGTTSG